VLGKPNTIKFTLLKKNQLDFKTLKHLLIELLPLTLLDPLLPLESPSSLIFLRKNLKLSILDILADLIEELMLKSFNLILKLLKLSIGDKKVELLQLRIKNNAEAAGLSQ